MRNVVFRVLIFYVLAIVVLSAIVPWQQAGLMESPFVQVFDMVGIPFAADLMNFVILTAILSVGNSGLYASTRILWAMSKTGMAPRSLSPLSSRGVPLRALFITLCFALVSLMTSFVAADTLFMVLMAVSGMSGTVTWIVIALAQYRFRQQFLRDGGQLSDLKYRAPLYPLVPLLCITLCSSLFVFLAMDETQRPRCTGALASLRCAMRRISWCSASARGLGWSRRCRWREKNERGLWAAFNCVGAGLPAITNAARAIHDGYIEALIKASSSDLAQWRTMNCSPLSKASSR